MTSRRKRKKEAWSLGLSERELLLAEMVEEMLEQIRWLYVLGYSNQYLVAQKLNLDKAERDKILEAATRAVDKDAKLHEWQERLARIKGEATRITRMVEGENEAPAADRGESTPDERAADG